MELRELVGACGEYVNVMIRDHEGVCVGNHWASAWVKALQTTLAIYPVDKIYTGNDYIEVYLTNEVSAHYADYLDRMSNNMAYVVANEGE